MDPPRILKQKPGDVRLGLACELFFVLKLLFCLHLGESACCWMRFSWHSGGSGFDAEEMYAFINVLHRLLSKGD